MRTVTEDGRPTTRARRDTMFAMGIEVAPGGMIHAHAAVYGEYLTEKKASELWETATGWPGEVNIALMDAATPDVFKKSLREVLKYITKGDKGRAQHERAARIEFAMRSLRRVEFGGAMRKAAPVDQKDVITEGQQCAECGASQRWRWTGIKPAHYVEMNGGFGVDKWSDISDASQQNKAALYEGHFHEDAPAFLTVDEFDNPLPRYTDAEPE